MYTIAQLTNVQITFQPLSIRHCKMFPFFRLLFTFIYLFIRMYLFIRPVCQACNLVWLCLVLIVVVKSVDVTSISRVCQVALFIFLMLLLAWLTFDLTATGFHIDWLADAHLSSLLTTATSNYRACENQTRCYCRLLFFLLSKKIENHRWPPREVSTNTIYWFSKRTI